MNEVFQDIMTFINDNTVLLICICVFLIFVLIGYLIDNSVKSKRVRKDIKNKDQVPEEIRNEIIKEALNENKEKIMENSFHNIVREESSEIDSSEVNLEDKNSNLEETINLELNLDEVPSESGDLNSSLNLDSSDISTTPLTLDSNLDLNLNLENNVTSEISEQLNLGENTELSNSVLDTPLDLSTEEPIVSEPLVLDAVSEEEKAVVEPIFGLDNVETQEEVETTTVEDPDLNIMNVEEDSKYKNAKKLSEILLNVDKERVNSKIDSNLFEEKTIDVEIKSDAEESKVEIQQDDSSDELDKIMKKLSSMNNEEEDKYTNIC